jgi:hypothetical protein
MLVFVDYYLWCISDLQVRKEMRERAWEVEGWSSTVYNTGIYLL